jgi:hypothetical protein
MLLLKLIRAGGPIARVDAVAPNESNKNKSNVVKGH